MLLHLARYYFKQIYSVDTRLKAPLALSPTPFGSHIYELRQRMQFAFFNNLQDHLRAAVDRATGDALYRAFASIANLSEANVGSIRSALVDSLWLWKPEVNR
jgi:hypothetical protein